MFERYTEEARRVIFFARRAASEYGTPYIETEHLLIALFYEDRRLLEFTLPSLSLDAVRREAERHKTDMQISTAVDMPLSNQCKRVLAYGAEEAERLSNKHIGTEHILLGLLRERDGIAAEIFRTIGAKAQTVRESVREYKKMPPIQTGLYCPKCAREALDPLTCGDCSAVICRVCGTPLEAAADLGFGD